MVKDIIEKGLKERLGEEVIVACDVYNVLIHGEYYGHVFLNIPVSMTVEEYLFYKKKQVEDKAKLDAARAVCEKAKESS